MVKENTNTNTMLLHENFTNNCNEPEYDCDKIKNFISFRDIIKTNLDSPVVKQPSGNSDASYPLTDGIFQTCLGDSGTGCGTLHISLFPDPKGW